MKHSYSNLKKFIDKNYKTKKEFANDNKFSYEYLRQRIQYQRAFHADVIYQIKNKYKLSWDEVEKLFFQKAK